MKIIESVTLEGAMEAASNAFDCSVTQLHIEVVQHPTSGMLGLFKKKAIIAVVRKQETPKREESQAQQIREPKKEAPKTAQERPKPTQKREKPAPKESYEKPIERESSFSDRSEIITPSVFVTAQDDYEEFYEEDEFKPTQNAPRKERTSKEEVKKKIAQAQAQEESIKRVTNDNFEDAIVNDFFENRPSMDEMIETISVQINRLFSKACFTIDPIKVSVYDENTILIEFTGEDAALLIGKEGYRYKALSYMFFNWINAKYGLQLRLEIAEFLKNQEEMVYKYLEGVSSQIDSDGRAQTKILDGVLLQIALKKLRASYPDKYVAIRTNREGLKYIIVNSFRNNNG